VLTIPSEVIRARCAHLSADELRLARVKLGVHQRDVEGPPVGVVVGEAPGPRSSIRHALFPYPASSSAGRLMGFARMPPGVFLGRLLRRNLCREEFSATEAERAALLLLRELDDMDGEFRILLLGVGVGRAFGLGAFYDYARTRNPHADVLRWHDVVCIPHPSGLNHLYNEPAHRRAAAAALTWAAGLGGRGTT
jgi:hypothetical protein